MKWSRFQIDALHPNYHSGGLRLNNAAGPALLRQLRERQGATAAAPRVLRDRVILVGGGGAGFQLGRHPAVEQAESVAIFDNQRLNKLTSKLGARD